VLSTEGAISVRYLREYTGRRENECSGIRWKDSYATLGRFDVVDIVEANDPKQIEKAAMIIRAYGHSTTETLMATPWREFLARCKKIRPRYGPFVLWRPCFPEGCMRFEAFSFGSGSDRRRQGRDLVIDHGEVCKRKKRASKKFRAQSGCLIRTNVAS
jgi:uncharacterized protein with GYD domain